ncbi:MAG TPA: hypothetical protein VJP06_00675 [Thermoplasmata archaeon]|nr:hypothetical protein [Thermoplasmata archaeon]
MVVVAKISISANSGKVRTTEGIFQVTLEKDDWYSVAGPVPHEVGQVRYDDDRNSLEIQRPEGRLSIHFKPELEHTTFEWKGHSYQMGTLDFGEISIKEGSRAAVRGHGTVSGVRLLAVAPDLSPIERELAFGLALRSAAIDRDLWREDRPLLSRWKL